MSLRCGDSSQSHEHPPPVQRPRVARGPAAALRNGDAAAAWFTAAVELLLNHFVEESARREGESYGT